jgi:hypothetical protein
MSAPASIAAKRATKQQIATRIPPRAVKTGRAAARPDQERRAAARSVPAPRVALVEHPPLRAVPARRPFAGAAAVVLVVVFLAMLGLTTFQTRMAQQQVRIDQLDRQVDSAKARHADLLRQRAELRSMQRLDAESKRLGMQQAQAVGFVTVDPNIYASVLAASGRLTPPADDIDPEGEGTTDEGAG